MPIISGGGGAPTGAAGGDLSGTYPNPTVGAGKVTTAKLASAVTLDAIATAHATAADVALNNNKITGLATPTLAGDAASKSYVDAAINGLDWKAACRLATAAPLPTNVYANGASGVGATLTGVAFGALTVDGVTPTIGDRILVKNEASGANNGIYVVTVVGGIAALYVLTRAADYNQTSEIVSGTATYVVDGTANVDTSWVMTTTGTITVGTTALVFTQFGAGGSQIEYDYAQITSPVSVTANSDGNGNGTAVIDGNAVTYDGSTRIKIEFYCPYVLLSVTGDNGGLVNLYDGTTDLGRLGNVEVQTSTGSLSNLTPFYVARFLTPAAGSHTYHIRGWRTISSANFQVGAGAGGASVYMPAWYRITKA